MPPPQGAMLVDSRACSRLRAREIASCTIPASRALMTKRATGTRSWDLPARHGDGPDYVRPERPPSRLRPNERWVTLHHLAAVQDREAGSGRELLRHETNHIFTHIGATHESNDGCTTLLRVCERLTGPIDRSDNEETLAPLRSTAPAGATPAPRLVRSLRRPPALGSGHCRYRTRVSFVSPEYRAQPPPPGSRGHEAGLSTNPPPGRRSTIVEPDRRSNALR